MKFLHIFIVKACEEEPILFTPENFPDIDFTFITTGVGKVNATMNLTREIMKNKPDFVINLGTAGADKPNKIGDIKVCTRFSDRNLEDDCSLSEENYSPLYNTDMNLIPEDGSLCSTGDNFLLESRNDADVYDMEAFALAKVCQEFKIPFVSVKYITDIIGENSIDVWKNNVTSSGKVLGDWVNMFCNYID